MPVKAISVSRLYNEVGYKPHAVQRTIHKAAVEARFRVVCAGRRTGKSTLGGHELMPRAIEAYYNQANLNPHGKRMEFWIVGPEYSDAEKEFRVLWNDLTALGIQMDHPGSYYDANGGNMHISLWGGRFLVHAKSAKYPGSLVGEALDGVIFAEAAKLKPSIWHKYIRPTLADRRGSALMTSTPEGKNWFYELWQFGQQNRPNWWSIRMPSWSNDIVFPEGRYDPEILDMSAGMSEEKFKQEIAAEFTEFVGRVFKNFDEEIHVGHYKYNPAWQTFAAVDFGWTNPFVYLLLQVDPHDNVYVIGEYYHSHKMVDEAAQEIKALGLAPASLRIAYCDPADPENAARLARELRIQTPGGTGGELQTRLELIRRWLNTTVDELPTNDAGVIHPKLFFDHSCINTIREFNDYRYPENKSETTRNDAEAPLKKDDHAPEALGRFFAGHYGPRMQAAGGSRVRSAKMGRAPVRRRSAMAAR